MQAYAEKSAIKVHFVTKKANLAVSNDVNRQKQINHERQIV